MRLRLIIAGLLFALSPGLVACGFVSSSVSPAAQVKPTTPTDIPTATPSPTPTSTPTVDERLAHIERTLTETSILSMSKDVADIALSIVSIAAVAVGALWGLRLYRQYRDKFPRAKIELRLVHWRLGDRGRLNQDLTNKPELEERTLMHVTVLITNISKVAISVERIKVQIRQILPLEDVDVAEALAQHPFSPVEQTTGIEFDWPTALPVDTSLSANTARPATGQKLTKGWYLAEPGETIELHYDFALNETVQVVSVYAFVEDTIKTNWTKRKFDNRENIGWSTQQFYDLSKPRQNAHTDPQNTLPKSSSSNKEEEC